MLRIKSRWCSSSGSTTVGGVVEGLVVEEGIVEGAVVGNVVGDVVEGVKVVGDAVDLQLQFES